MAWLTAVAERRSSIVWTLPEDEAARVLALDEDSFNRELTRAFAARLGELRLASPRAAFPLRRQLAHRPDRPHRAPAAQSHPGAPVRSAPSPGWRRRGNAWTLGANWYLNDFSRVMFEAVRWKTRHRSGSAMGRDEGTTFNTRLQLVF